MGCITIFHHHFSQNPSFGGPEILFLLPPSGMKFKETIDSKMQSNKSMHVLVCKEVCIQSMVVVQHLARLLDPKDLF